MVTPALSEAIVPDRSENTYEITCVNVFEAAVIVSVALCSIVSVGIVREEARGIVVNAHVPLHDRGPAPEGDVAMSIEAEQDIVFVPSVSCVTVVVPEAIVQVFPAVSVYRSLEYLS